MVAAAVVLIVQLFLYLSQSADAAGDVKPHYFMHQGKCLRPQTLFYLPVAGHIKREWLNVSEEYK